MKQTHNNNRKMNGSAECITAYRWRKHQTYKVQMMAVSFGKGRAQILQKGENQSEGIICTGRSCLPQPHTDFSSPFLDFLFTFLQSRNVQIDQSVLKVRLEPFPKVRCRTIVEKDQLLKGRIYGRKRGI